MRTASIKAATSTGRARFVRVGLALLALPWLTSCAKSSPPSAAAPGQTSMPSATGVPTAATTPGTAMRAEGATDGLAGRTGELTNPDNMTMVYLYYDLAGIAPPIDQWVEQDSRVLYGPGADKAARRASVKAAFEAGMAAVHGVGVIHLTSNAGLSQYDPTYGEFTIGALSPGSVYTFRAQGQTVTLEFDNGLSAQSWSVPKDKAQAIVDEIGNDSLTLDMTLKIDKVLPEPDGGTIASRIVSWNLRDARNGTTIARVQVPQK
jgi:hypothetical protein